MDKYETDICALQEIRWPGKGADKKKKKKNMILYSGHKSDKYESGTGFYISRHITNNLLHFKPIYERICKIWG